VAAASVMLAELELRERRTDAARAVIDEALDRIQYCTEDAARLARIAAAGVAVEASAVEHARDLGDADAERDALARAELMLARTEAGVEEVPGPIEHARLATARAAEAAARRDPGAASLWTEAIEQWQQVGRPYPEAWAHLGHAESLLAADEREGAAEAARAALAIARRVGIAWLAEEIESLAARARLGLGERAPAAPAGGETAEPEDPFGLTDRERQVLALVARGATNREIAGELFMAEKTASVHVSRILGKLGVRSRTEAAAVAHRQGLAGDASLAREPTP
jgi:DNA-binding CsgD family transcriptional regulator